MKRFTQRMSLVLAAALTVPAVSQAGFRAYLASTGVDNATCGVSNPCRLLPAALAAVSNGGEIWMLDSANFSSGTVTVNQNVTIQAIPGQVGSIAPAGGTPAMVINPGFTVKLRNISMVTNPVSPGTDGIQMTTGTLVVDNSVFEVWGSSFATPDGSAISVNGTGNVSVNNSVFRHGFRGIYALGGAIVDVNNSRFTDMSNASTQGGGVYVEASVASTLTKVNITNCTFANSYTGVWVRGLLSGSTAVATVSGSSASSTTAAFASQVSTTGAVTTLSISNSSASNNAGWGFYQQGTGATFESLSNNIVRNNGSANTTGTITGISGT